MVRLSRVSRREFLKYMGSGAVILAVSLFGSSQLFDSKRNRVRGQSAGGSWDSPANQPTGTTTVHAALLSGGKVLWLQGSASQHQFTVGPYKHGIWNPDGTFSNTDTLPDDLFCCGMATLANGNVLLCGGTSAFDGPFGFPKTSPNGKWAGGKYSYEADFNSGLIVGTGTEMAHGRWYPTAVQLPDNKVCVMQGLDEYGINNRLVEFYDPADKSWTIRLDPVGNSTWCAGQTQEAYDFSPLPPAGSQCYGPGTAPYLSTYPRMHLMPSGLIACVGMETVDRMYNPNTYKWVFSQSNVLKRHYGASVLLPLQNTDQEKGKILLAGGSPDATDPATNSCQIAEPSGTVGITRRSTASMTYARKHVGPVLLPTGEIGIFGGNFQQSEVGTAQLQPEVFDPVTETWQIWATAVIPRLYHQVAILLLDGRVWTAGTTTGSSSFENRIEVFNPWYMSETRPTISGDPTVGGYGETITIPTPDASAITKVSLLKQTSTTHHYNTDQRLIWLQILSRTATTVTVKAPINSKLAPPGIYLVHILNDAAKPVPSIGKFIQIPGPGDISDIIPPAQVTGLVATANGSTRIDLVWTANTELDLDHYNIYRGTTPNFIVVPSVDQPLGQTTANSYSDTGLTQQTTYYYKVAAVDLTGNIGLLSGESSTTTTTGTYVSIYSVTGANNYGKLYTGNLKRAGELMDDNPNSILLGQPVKKVIVIMKKSGSPSGTINIVVRNSAGSIVHTFGTVEAATLTSSDQSFEKEAASSYTIAADDRILVEWAGTGSSIDQVWVKRTSSSGAGWFDGSATKWTQYKTSYSNQTSYDLAGEWFKLA